MAIFKVLLLGIFPLLILPMSLGGKAASVSCTDGLGYMKAGIYSLKSVQGDGAAVFVTIEIADRKTPDTYDGVPRMGISADTLPPEKYHNIIRKISASLGGKPIRIRLNTFCDMAEVVKVCLAPKSHSFQIQVTGGDTSEAYTSSIVVSNGKVISRLYGKGELLERHGGIRYY